MATYFHLPKKIEMALVTPAVQPRIQAQPAAQAATKEIGIEPILPDPKMSKKQFKRPASHTHAAPTLSLPKFSGDVHTFIGALNTFINACNKLNNAWEQNKLLILALEQMLSFIKIEHTDISEKTIEKLINVIHHPVWAAHHLDIQEAKKFIAHEKSKRAALQLPPNLNDPVTQTAHIQAEKEIATEETAITPAAAAQSPPMQAVNMPLLKSPWLFCGIIPTLGYYLVNYAAMSPPQVSLVLTVMSFASVGAEYWVKSSKMEKINASIQTFEHEKIKFEADPSWDTTQFTGLMQALYQIPNRNMKFLKSDHPKTVFLRKVVAIHLVYTQYTDKISLSDHGLSLLNAVIHCYGGLEQASRAPYLFLAEPAPEDLSATHAQRQRIEINNYFVMGKPVSRAESDYIKRLDEIVKKISPALSYQVAYQHNQIKNMDAATIKKMHHSYSESGPKAAGFATIPAARLNK